jgi:hypothetical protein
VDLPAPFGPTRATLRPGRRSRSNPSSAGTATPAASRRSPGSCPE